MRIKNQKYKDEKSALEGDKVVESVFTKISVGLGKRDYRIKLIL